MLIFVVYMCRATLRSEAKTASMLVHNPANFGAAFDRQCICEVPGQVPCPAWLPLPQDMTGKGRRKLLEAAQEAAANASSSQQPPQS